MRVKLRKPPPPAPTASAIGPCPTVIKIVGRPGTGRLPSTIAPPDHPHAVTCDVFIDVYLCCPFPSRDVLDEIWDLNGSVSGSFPTYFSSYICLSIFTAKLEKRTQAFEMRCYRWLLNIPYKDHISKEPLVNTMNS